MKRPCEKDNKRHYSKKDDCRMIRTVAQGVLGPGADPGVLDPGADPGVLGPGADPACKVRVVAILVTLLVVKSHNSFATVREMKHTS